MNTRNFVVAPSVLETISSQVAYYEERGDEDYADQLESLLRDTLRKIEAGKPLSTSIAGLPPNYRRVKVQSYYFCLRFNQQQGYTLVFLLPHERQRPYSPATLRRKASEAEGELS